MKEKQKKKISFNKIRIKYIIMAAVIISIIAVVSIGAKTVSKKSKPEIITKSTLEEIINVSDLSTSESIYNGIAVVMNENKPEEIDYYVSYEAKVKAGIDFGQVDVQLNENDKIITVTLPEIKITDVNVDIASLDYIFMNKKANTETVSAQAYKKCIEDVTNESDSTNAIYELAEQNAQNIVEALIHPFVEQLDSEYRLEVK